MLSGCGGGGGGGGDTATVDSTPYRAAAMPILNGDSQLAIDAGDGNLSLAPGADASLLQSLPTVSGDITIAQGIVETGSKSLEQTLDELPVTAASSDSLPVDQVPPRTIQTTSQNTIATIADAPLLANNIADQAQANLSFSNQEWGNIQCNGSIVASQLIPAQGIHGKTLSNGQTLRFGRVADRSTTSGYAFQFTLNPEDAITSGSLRCELAFAANARSGIPRGSIFWHAFSVQLPDWGDTTDEQAIAQWHAGDTSGGMLPVYTLLVRGSVMRLVLRYDTSANPSRDTAKTIVVWSQRTLTPNRWLNFVTQANVATDVSQNPFVKTWLNGQLIVNYAGPVGYKQPTVQSYAKHGIYHWVDSTNEWDMSIPTRTLKIKRPLIVRDANRLYAQPQIEALLNTE